jgi:hypothetical protein
MASKRARAGEQVALEVGAQAVAHHRDAKPVGNARQLPDLLFLQELRLVDEDAVHIGVLVVLGDAGITGRRRCETSRRSASSPMREEM